MKGASNESIDFLPEATPEQRDQAAALLLAHDPTDYAQQRAEAAVDWLLNVDWAQLKTAIESLPNGTNKSILAQLARICYRLTALAALAEKSDPF